MSFDCSDESSVESAVSFNASTGRSSFARTAEPAGVMRQSTWRRSGVLAGLITVPVVAEATWSAA